MERLGVDVSVIAGRPDGMGPVPVGTTGRGNEPAARSGLPTAISLPPRPMCGPWPCAAKAGVDVRLLVPGSSNWPLVGALSKSAYRPLLQAGVRVFEWNGPMVHAKTAVADGVWTRIGSAIPTSRAG